jgi:hypothetical protein
LTENPDPETGASSAGGQDDKESYRRPFNPMRTYFELAVGIFGVYALYYLLGVESLVISNLAILIFVIRQARFVLQYYSYGFARKASVFNVLYGLGFFVILTINVFTIADTGVPLILPDWDTLTLTCPLFILMAAFGNKNIERMYKPSDEMLRAHR